MEAKTARGNSLVGTLKRLFKPTKSSWDGNSPRKAPLGIFGVSDLSPNSIGRQVSISSGGNELNPSLSTRRALERPALAQGAGTDVPPALRPAYVAEAALHHSISDPCDNPHGLQANPLRPYDTGCFTDTQKSVDYQKFQPVSTARLRRGSTATCATLKAAPRTDVALPTLNDPAMRSCPMELSNGPASGPVGMDGSIGKTRAPTGVSLPIVGARSPTAPTSSPLPSECYEVPLAEPAPPASKTTLLAMCPGTPPGMRRKDWCIEDYDVFRKIYKGSTSAVYKATCRRSGIQVALKVYFLSRVPANVIHMIVREIKIHTELVHRNIVMLYAAFQDEKRLVLVQEYAARGDLYVVHRAMNRRMSEAQVTALVLSPFMDALAYLHSRGICHRDIKPENVLFTQDWRLLIADFGVSINLAEERAVTRAGTLEYMAPEVERCPLKMLPEENKDKQSLAYTTAVDIWAVGVLAYELLVGFPPFVSDSAAAASSSTGATRTSFLATHATRKTLSFPASTSPQARNFISAALAESPEERPTALQLSRHPWLAVAQAATGVSSHQLPMRRASGQLAALGATPLAPSRLGSTPLGSAPNSGAAQIAI